MIGRGRGRGGWKTVPLAESVGTSASTTEARNGSGAVTAGRALRISQDPWRGSSGGCVDTGNDGWPEHIDPAQGDGLRGTAGDGSGIAGRPTAGAISSSRARASSREDRDHEC